MSNSIPLSDLEGGTSAKFAEIGSRHTGRIVDMVERQQTDIDNKPLTWPDGNPRMQWVITLEQANGDRINLYCKGGKFTPATGTGASMRTAIGLAVREAGAEAVEVGGELAVEHTGLSKPEPGKNAAKLYVAAYRPPKAQPASVSVDDLFND